MLFVKKHAKSGSKCVKGCPLQLGFVSQMFSCPQICFKWSQPNLKWSLLLRMRNRQSKAMKPI